jgi:uncharacterized membrane protein (UPF0127 family)
MMNGLRGLLAATVALSMTSACAAEPAAAAKSPPPPATAQPAAATPAPCAALKGAKPAGFERLDVITATGCASFYVEIADDDAEREQGLMFRKSLAPDRGMLFDFHSPREVAFWMHNTLIPLDIIYVQADGTVLSIARNAMPLSDAPIPSGGPILGVLELPGGRAAEIGLLPGDQIKHRMFPGG